MVTMQMIHKTLDKYNCQMQYITTEIETLMQTNLSMKETSSVVLENKGDNGAQGFTKSNKNSQKVD